jgi:hypothetical protein
MGFKWIGRVVAVTLKVKVMANLALSGLRLHLLMRSSLVPVSQLQQMSDRHVTLCLLYCLCAVVCQAIIACRCQRAAPTLTTVFEIAALTAPLIKGPHDADQPGSSSAPGTDAGYVSDTYPTDSSSSSGRQAGQHKQHGPEAVLQSPLGLTHALVVLALRGARGWAPAVVVAQGVRLVGSLVQRREQPHEEARQEGSEGMLQGQLLLLGVATVNATANTRACRA